MTRSHLREKKKLLRSKHEEIGSQGYASVEVQHQKHIVTTLIQWADGLEKHDFGAHGLLLCLATNMKDALDPAISDRARKHIEFHLPSKAQRLDWWERHSRHLRSSEHTYVK